MGIKNIAKIAYPNPLDACTNAEKKFITATMPIVKTLPPAYLTAF